MKNFFRLLLCVACACVMMGCEKEEKDKITYTGQLTFTNSTVEVLKDLTIKLDYTTTSSLLENELLWESADENIAIVDSEGNVTGMNYGETDITAKYHNNEWTCHIIVNNIIPLDKTTLEWILYKYDCDTNGDGLLSTNEASSITELDLTYTDYSARPDYTGNPLLRIEPKFTILLPSFTNVECLYILFDKYIKDSDIIIQGLQNLKRILVQTEEYDNFNDYSIIINNLTSLETLTIRTSTDRIEIGNLPNLKELELNTFHTKKDMTNIIDISKFSNLEKFQIIYYDEFNHEFIEIVK